MAKMISYGDNLFFVGELVRVLKDGLQLDLDPSIFAEKLVEQILFVDHTLTKIYAALKGNPLLIDRPEHLKSLMRTSKLTADLLDGLLRERFALSEELRPLYPKLADIRDEKRNTVQEIQTILAQSDSSESGDMISPAEYEFLLMDPTSDQQPSP